MNILVIPSWYPNGTDKLMGIYHKEFCEALAKRDNINVNMLYLDRQRLSAPLKYLFMPKKEVIQEEGYKTYMRKMLDLHKISFDIEMKKYARVLEKAFKDYIKENPKPDIIHAQVTNPAGYAACKLGKKYNIPVVVTEHATYYERFFKGEDYKYGKYVLDNSYFTTVSAYMKKEILKMSNQCDVLANLVDTENFKKERKKVKGLRLVTVVGLRKVKRVDDIMAALKILIDEHKIKDAKLTVVGDGFDEEYYKNRCQELGMEKYVDFVGRKNKEEIANILLKNNIYVMASEIESFGIPAIEAFASGLPVVATKCLGPEEYVDDKCGKLISIGDSKEMAEAILEVYQNLDKYNIKYLRSVADRYGAKSVTDKAIKIYKELLKK